MVLVAQDKHSNLNPRYGQFRTLERHVEVTFTSIYVKNDADKWDINKGLVIDDPAIPAGYDAAFMLRTRDHYLQFDAYGTIDIWYE